MVDILAFGAHPDDVEFGCGGILAKAASEGKSIVIVDLTLGQKGTNGSPELRKAEGEAAASSIGAKRFYLDFNDCEVFDTYEGRLKLVKVIREHKPRLILAPVWSGERNHPDHLACGLMARYACRYARFAKILPELPIHRSDGILHYLPHGGKETDFIVDVSSHMKAWKRMMDAHASQMLTSAYSEKALKNAANYGAMIDRPYAQGLLTGNPILVDDILTISRGTQEI
ncbi:MAG TPA: PIG-L family deacetylase [Parachlamydiaceae bacterium]|nr:PIG-L family deacetylase [Parachlamydiaceae bacterium]